jgi:class 3 adenylate cyclase/tetratricopeptide (TPR) repeat protein
MLTAQCDSCGRDVPPLAKFCPECGTPTAATHTESQPTRKTVSVVFSDLVGSTSLGEVLDVESLRQILDEYFDAIRAVIEKHGGVVEKFIGDAVMAVFGLTQMHEDDALRAVRAADEMRSRLAALNDQLDRTRGIRLEARTGVNTGTVIVGDAGAGHRLATGDAVNVAARLEQAAPPGGILLGPSTARLVREYVEMRPVGALALKGKSDPIAASEFVHFWQDSASRLAPRSGALVGRRLELALVLERFRVAIDEPGTEFVLLVGEAGVGKSRLLRELTEAFGEARVLVASCRPYGTPSLWPVVQLLSRLGDSDGRLDPNRIAQIASVVPSADERPIADRVSAFLGLTDAAFPIEECLWATARLFQALAAERPLVLVIEDLHWAEDALLDLLDHMRMAGQSSPCLILGSGRPEILERRWSSDAVWHQETVHLETLTEGESDECIDGLLGGVPVPADVRAQVRRAAEGNPLFLEQALLTWIEEGVLVSGEDGWRLTRSITEVHIPDTIAAIFASRLDRLEGLERRALEAAAAIGPVFRREAVHALVAALGDADPSEALDRLVVAGLLHPVELPVTGTIGLAFVHASLRDVAYAMTLKTDRATFHETYARWIESLPGEEQSDDLIGHHLAAAYAYHAELRRLDDASVQLGIAAARRLAAACQRALAVGDRATADRLMVRIVDVLTSLGPSSLESDLDLVERIAKLLVTLGAWPEAVTLLHPFAGSNRGAVLRDLGVAMCQLDRADPFSAGYREGQQLLERATVASPGDTDAIASLAGTWKGVDDDLAERLYRECLALDPGNPYALGNVVEYAVGRSRNGSVVDEMRSQIEIARLRCRHQADTASNLPWAFFDAGKFELLLGHPYAALASYAKAAQLASAEHMLTTSMASLQRLEGVDGGLAGCSWALDLLALARAVRFPSTAARAGLERATPISGVTPETSVLIVAGGTDDTARAWLDRHGPELNDSFEAFAGVVVSGGTADGVAGLTADIRDRHEGNVFAVGYAPAVLPDAARIDGRYDEVRRVPGEGFSIAQSLQALSDLVVSGVSLTDVKLFGLNGGQIAAAEYRVCLALGCLVGVVAGSGREADRLFEDPDWVAAPNMIRIDERTTSVRRFLLSDA